MLRWWTRKSIAGSMLVAIMLGLLGTYEVRAGTLGGQQVSAALPAEAFLPCHLEMTCEISGESFALESREPESAVEKVYGVALSLPAPGCYLAGWNAVNGSTKKPVEPAPGIFVKVADTLTTTVWSNHNYRYVVGASEGGCLKLSGGESLLPLSMRFSLVNRKQLKPGDWVEGDLTQGSVTVIEGMALQGRTVAQQFRALYDQPRPSGTYVGELSLQAFNI